MCRDKDCLHHRSYSSIRVFFWASCSWQLEGLFGQSFSIAPPVQALRGLPCLGSFSVVQAHQAHKGTPLAGVLLCRLVHQSVKGAPWVGSYSVIQCVRSLMAQPIYCSAANAGIWGERGCGDGSTPCTWLSSIALPLRLLGFPPQAFPTTISSLTSPQSVSLQSTAALTPGLLHNPKLQLPTVVPSRGPASLSGVCMAAARTIWFSFHLGCHRSAVSRSALNVSPLTQTTGPMWGLDPVSVPPPAKGRSSPTNTPIFPPVPSSYQVSRGSIYSFPLVRYSCLLSAGAMHALLCLKVYFWCICGEVLHVHLLLRHLVQLQKILKLWLTC